MKKPQNYGRIPPFFNRMFNRRRYFTLDFMQRNFLCGFMLSGDEGDRTLNLLVANQALSQLSYVPGRKPGLADGPRRPRVPGAGIPPGTCTMITSSGRLFQLDSFGQSVSR